jgi:hypothetical protein
MWRNKSGVWCEESERAECLEGTGQLGRRREERRRRQPDW